VTNKKTYIKRVLCILLIPILYFCCDRSLSQIFENIISQTKQRFVLIYKGGISSEVLIIGNSRGVNAFYAPDIERSLNSAVFNLSYNGMSMKIAQHLFMDYLDHNKPPELLILEISNINSEHGLLTDLKLISSASARITELLRIKENYTYWAMTIAHLYRYNGELTLRSLYYMKNDDQTWINAGEIDKKYAENIRLEEKEKKFIPQIKYENIAALEEILKKCDELKITVRLVISPYLPSYIEQIDDYSEWKRFIQREIGKNLSIKDYSTAIRNIAAFADLRHLNITGSRLLLPIMLKDGLFFREESITHEKRNR
jgi:hypothetical protein